MVSPTSSSATGHKSPTMSMPRRRNLPAEARWFESWSSTRASRVRRTRSPAGPSSSRWTHSTNEPYTARDTMRLTRIEIGGFGSLHDLDLRFGPAMNLVVGPNEAGKSTLQEAIVTGLYGLLAGDRS